MLKDLKELPLLCFYLTNRGEECVFYNILKKLVSFIIDQNKFKSY